MGSKRISEDTWETVDLCIWMCLDEDTEVTSHNVAAYAEMFDFPEVTQSRAFKRLNLMYQSGELDRRETTGPTEYVFSRAKRITQ